MNRTDSTNTHDKRSPAQWYCLLVGLGLLVGGLAGFAVDSTFDADNGVQGDAILGFEVNGWHNLVHVLSGLALLAASPKIRTARTAALAFGVVYGLVALVGLIDGNDVLTFMPVNAADNILHIALSALGIIAALAPHPALERDGRARRLDPEHTVRPTTGHAEDAGTTGRGSGRFTREPVGRELTPETHDETTTRR